MLSIIVAFPKIEDALKIKKLLNKNGYEIVYTFNNATQVIELANSLESGVVLCGYKLADMVYVELYGYLPKNFTMMLVASPAILDRCFESDIICVAMPLKLNVLISSLENAIAIQRRKYKKNKPKERTAEQQKVIDEAKALLMSEHNMSENDAHRYIQKISMDSGNSLSETAEMILLLK